MSVIHVDLTRSDDRRDVVHRAVQMLAEGKLVVLPTETVYGVAASSLCPQAVERLLEVKGRASSDPLTSRACVSKRRCSREQVARVTATPA